MYIKEELVEANEEFNCYSSDSDNVDFDYEDDDDDEDDEDYGLVEDDNSSKVIFIE